MKKIHIYSLTLLLWLVSGSTIQAQVTAEGSCSSLTITSTPSFEGNLFISGAWKISEGCNQYLLWGSPASPRHTLEFFDFDDGDWVQVAGPIHSGNTFTGLAHGTYRVRTALPVRMPVACTWGNFARVFNSAGQWIGFRGIYGPDMFSDPVVVGPAVQSDIAYEFVDGDGNDFLPDGFDYGEVVTIDPSETRNYTHWWLAIFENGGQQRYRSNGWTQGALPATIDLSHFWEENRGWKFEQFNSYTVQFAIGAPCNPSWINLDKTFWICPTGQGCRGVEPDQEITLYPNPTVDAFKLKNFRWNLSKDTRIVLSDMSGRMVRSFQPQNDADYNVADIPAGMYTVTVQNGKERLYSTKLSITK